MPINEPSKVYHEPGEEPKPGDKVRWVYFGINGPRSYEAVILAIYDGTAKVAFEGNIIFKSLEYLEVIKRANT